MAEHAHLPPPSAMARRITGIALATGDVARTAAFYRALGFVDGAGSGAAGQASLRLAAFTLELRQAAAPYPAPRAANDPWFQHFALAVADIDAAARTVLAAGATPISRGGPQLLPPNTGGVTAFKFRDPDGHPLELSLIPGSRWLADAAPGAVFLGVDHTALAVADLAAAQAWYEALGFVESGRSRNTGPEQDRLDGLTGVVVDIVALSLPGPSLPGPEPHLELLCYRSPAPAAVRAIADDNAAATVTRLAAANLPPRDPDGHRLAANP